MTPQSRIFVVLLVITMVAAALGGWIGVQYGIGHSQQLADLDVMLHRDLDLTSEQDRQIRALEESLSADRANLQTEMHAANRDLANALTKDHAYGPDARRAVERFHRAMTALQEKTIEHVLAMRAVLTPDQAKKFDQTVAKALSANAS